MSEHTGILARLSEAERMLAEVRSAQDVEEIRRMAEAARVLARQMHLGTEAINHATTIKLKAEVRLADVVDEGQANGEIATSGERANVRGADVCTLSEIGVSKQRLSEARVLRDAVEEGALDIETEVDAATEKDREVSRKTLVRKARNHKAQKAKDDKARRTVEAKELPRNVALRVGDFREVLSDIPDGSLDAIITDPPYPGEFLPLFDDLKLFADRVLKPDGVLAVMSGQTHLPEVYVLMMGGRPYRWTIAYMTPGSGYASHARRVQSNWKPVLVYGGGPRFGDVVTSDGESKHLHEWGQDVAGFAQIVERLTEPGSLVCDPFLGAGTTAVAAVSLGRDFIGCDIDEAHVSSARDRLL